jgi:hypothetical protein
MTKDDFLGRLEKSLRGRVEDLGDILGEYEQHFARKLADGYGEEEIAARLGEPEALAEQFAESASPRRRPGKAFAFAGVCILSLFALCAFVALFAWVIGVGAGAIASFATGICLVSPLRIGVGIPPMPYVGSLLLGLSILAFSVLCALATGYSFLFVVQLCRAYFRWAGNSLKATVLPPLPVNPQLPPARRRRLRSLALAALAVMGGCFVAAYAVMAIMAGSLGFWHVWRWFL